MKTHGLSRSRIYRIWNNMHERCYRRNNKNFKDYGARGIRVCRRWHVFMNFVDDMGHPPLKHSLDRTNNNRGYSPKNCRWVTHVEQCRNRRNNVFVSFRGKRLCLKQWGEELGVYWKTLDARLRLGWGVHRALTTPVAKQDWSLITFDDKSDSVTGWARNAGISRTAMKIRINRGWPLGLALTLPADTGRRIVA